MIQTQNNELKLNDGKVSILYFSAVWCGPCKMLKPIMEEISKEMSDNIDIHYIDLNDNIELAGKYQIMSVPSLLFIKEGEIKNKIVGVQTKTNIVNAINNIQ
jgi:thioredoxin 1